MNAVWGAVFFLLLLSLLLRAVYHAGWQKGKKTGREVPPPAVPAKAPGDRGLKNTVAEGFANMATGGALAGTRRREAGKT